MRTRFNLSDVAAAVKELKSLIGMRVNNIYDIDNKTYLIKLQKPEDKAVLLFESGIRIHRTFTDWPKSQSPSSFTMKLRKHIKQKRMTEIRQLGSDRVVLVTFGEEDRTNHLIIELYDRGNVILTDHEFVILNILRPRTDKEDVRFAVKETYDLSHAEGEQLEKLDRGKVEDAFAKAKKGDTILQILAPITKYGNPISKEVLMKVGVDHSIKYDVGSEKVATAKSELIAKLDEIQKLYDEIWEQVAVKESQGYISLTKQQRSDGVICEAYKEFNPVPLTDKNSELKAFPSFCEAVDEFFSKIESQKQEQKALNVEKAAFKKLDNVKKDQELRVEALAKAQEERELMAQRVIVNKDLVERALLLLRTALANQYSWSTIAEMQKAAAEKGDPVAKSIVALNFDRNEFTMKLADPYDHNLTPIEVPIEISLNSSKNAQKYFSDKKFAAEKVQKTLASSGQAIKNAQEKARNTLAQVRITTEIKKARKPMWFEKFHWFVSSQGFIVVGGRDAQQNELLVKRYMRSGDIYVHADVRGAASVVIRNKSGSSEIPPKTLTEAAQMAVCYSNAWEANISANAWWVRHDQVSRTAPTGEYLPSGSFMIRGKKNFMPPSQLVMGFGLLFKLDEESAERHKEQERIKAESAESAPGRTGSTDDEKAAQVDFKRTESSEVAPDDEFPDVQVSMTTADDEVTIIELGPKNVQRKGAPVGRTDETKKYIEQKQNEENVAAAAVESARTQKRKQRKEKLAKIKYKDQTEEDRLLQMELLKAAGKKPEPPQPPQPKPREPKSEQPSEVAEKQERPPREPKEPKEKEQAEEEDDDKETGQDDSEAMLSSLTSTPNEDDVLLYVVPVVGPYQVMINYKYKVKLTPGPGKRGKAAKSAIELFIRSKTGREAALIKSLMTDEGTSRNLPPKIRVSAPQLHAK